jgi:hypothetical protein
MKKGMEERGSEQHNVSRLADPAEQGNLRFFYRNWRPTVWEGF